MEKGKRFFHILLSTTTLIVSSYLKTWIMILTMHAVRGFISKSAIRSCECQKVLEVRSASWQCFSKINDFTDKTFALLRKGHIYVGLCLHLFEISDATFEYIIQKVLNLYKQILKIILTIELANWCLNKMMSAKKRIFLK